MRLLILLIAVACQSFCKAHMLNRPAGKLVLSEKHQAFTNRGHDFIEYVQHVVYPHKYLNRQLLTAQEEPVAEPPQGFAEGTQVAEVERESDDGRKSNGLGVANGKSSGNVESENKGEAKTEIDNNTGDTKSEAIQEGRGKSNGADVTSQGGAIGTSNTNSGKADSAAGTQQNAEEGLGAEQRQATADAIAFAVASDQAEAGAQAAAVALNYDETEVLAEGLAEGIVEADGAQSRVNRVQVVAEIIAELLPFVEETGVTAELIIAVQRAVFKGELSGDERAKEDMVVATAEGIAIAVSRGETEAVAVALVEASAAGGDVAKAAALAISIAISEQGCFAIAAAYSRALVIAEEEGTGQQLAETISESSTLVSCEGLCVPPNRTCTTNDTCCTAFRDQHECSNAGICVPCGGPAEPPCATTDLACNHPLVVNEVSGLCETQKDTDGECLELETHCSLTTSSCCASSVCLLKECRPCGSEGGFCCFEHNEKCDAGMECSGGVCGQPRTEVKGEDAGAPELEPPAPPVVEEEVDEPVAKEPEVEEPEVEQPEAEEPVVEEPVAKEPEVEEPVAKEPVAKEPVVEEPVVEEPVAKEPVVEEPVAKEPVVEEPVAKEPVVEEPVVEEPAEKEPVVEEPVVEEPVVEEPVVEEPSEKEPVVEEPAEKEPVVEEPVVEEPVVEKPAEKEPVVEEPAEKEPVVEEPSEKEPVVEEPAEKEPVPEPEVQSKGKGSGKGKGKTNGAGTGTKSNGTGTKSNGTGTKTNGVGTKSNGTGTISNGTGTISNGAGAGQEKKQKQPIIVRKPAIPQRNLNNNIIGSVLRGNSIEDLQRLTGSFGWKKNDPVVPNLPIFENVNDNEFSRPSIESFISNKGAKGFPQSIDKLDFEPQVRNKLDFDPQGRNKLDFDPTKLLNKVFAGRGL